MEIFKIIGVGLLTCFLAIIVKQIKPEFYIFIVITGSIIIFLMVLDKFTAVINYFAKIFERTNIDSNVFLLILKIVGVAFLTEFASGLCVDSGSASLGDKIVFAGKILILFMALPIITNLIEMIIEMLPWIKLNAFYCFF